MEQLIKQFNLPKYIKGKSFADASKMIESKFEGMNDKISNETKMEMLQRLSEAQEFMKAQQQSQQSQQSQGMPQDQIGMDNFNHQAYGGYTNDYFLGGLASTALSGIASKGLDMSSMTNGLNTPPDLASTTPSQIPESSGGEGITGALGKAGGMIGGVADLAKGFSGEGLTGDKGSDILGSAAKGVSLGSSFGPLGGAIGGVVGGISGWIGSAAAKRKILNDKRNKSQKAAGEINNEYEKGGYTNGQEDDINFKLDPFDFNQDFTMVDEPGRNLNNNNINFKLDPVNVDNIVEQKEYIDPNDDPTMPNKPGNKSVNEYDESFLRYAPVGMSALQMFNMDDPEQETLDRLGKRYKKDYVDEEMIQNQVQNEYNNTAEALANATGGNKSALRANILGAQLNKTKALSDAYMKANNINRQQNDAAQRFDLGVDQFNVGQSNTEKDINARNRAAYDNNKSKFLGQIGNDLGDIGLEAYRRRYPEKMGLDYDSSGKAISVTEAERKARLAKKNKKKASKK